MVTVLLATYHGEQFLPAQIASLQAQNMQDFTVLWQEDGDTAPLFPEDGRFLPGRYQGMHFGAAGNFFNLMQQSCTDYTALCDQDDLWHPDRLSRCMDAMRQAEAACGRDTPLLIHSDCRLIDGEGRLLRDSFFRHQGWAPTAVTLNRLIVQNNATGCTMLMNAALRDLVCAHLPEEPVLHDWWIALTAASFGRVVCLPEALVDYRQHSSNVIGASKSRWAGRIQSALKAPEKTRARIRLTYDMARLLIAAYGDCLPVESRECLTQYLAAENMGKLRRTLAIRQGGYTMQNPITRFGQIIFG